MLRVLRGEPSLLMNDESDKLRVGMSVLKGDPNLWILDENGKQTWTAP
jgi:hypothetical protein